MSRKRVTTTGAILVLLGLTAASVLPSLAQEDPLPIAVELLTPRSDFTDTLNLRFRYKLEGNPVQVISVNEPSLTIVARITVQPGAMFPWHTHPGPVLVTVAQGELVYVQAKDCIERDYPAGTAFVDPGRGNVHTAFNPDAGETILVATFFQVPETGPLTITEGIGAPDDCDLGMEMAEH